MKAPSSNQSDVVAATGTLTWHSALGKVVCMRHARGLVLVPLVSSIVTLTLVPSATADRLSRSDARADVVAVVADGAERINKPSQVDPDVVRTLVAHGDHAVVLRLRFRDLLPHKRRSLLTVVRTSGDSYSVSVTWRRNGSAAVQIEHNPDVVACPGLTPRLDAGRNIIRVRIPRACVGSPRWVRVSMHIDRFVPSSFTMLTDDPLRDGTVPFAKLSRRLYRD